MLVLLSAQAHTHTHTHAHTQFLLKKHPEKEKCSEGGRPAGFSPLCCPWGTPFKNLSSNHLQARDASVATASPNEM